MYTLPQSRIKHILEHNRNLKKARHYTAEILQQRKKKGKEISPKKKNKMISMSLLT